MEMNRNKTNVVAMVAALIAVAAALPVIAAPQRPQGGGQGGRGGGMGGPGGGMGRRQPLPASAATIPLDVMTGYLKLTADQAAKIKTITQTLREAGRPPRPEPGQDGERPAPPSREEREAQRKVMEAATQKASTEITNLLTDEQKPRLATLVKGFDAMQAARIPPFAAQDLKLTDDQWVKIAALGTGATRESVIALLTDAQKTAVESARPPRRGGPGGEGPGGGGPGGGFGGPGGGGPGGPPPDGGFGGPPPPDAAF